MFHLLSSVKDTLTEKTLHVETPAALCNATGCDHIVFVGSFARNEWHAYLGNIHCVKNPFLFDPPPEVERKMRLASPTASAYFTNNQLPSFVRHIHGENGNRQVQAFIQAMTILGWKDNTQKQRPAVKAFGVIPRTLAF
jgi:hypothetical protein